MTATTTPTPGPSGPSGERAGLTLTRREARALARRARQGARAGQGERWLPRVWQEAAAGRAAARRRAGRRGWPGRGTGRVNYVEPAVEYQGTTVQVCGLWPMVAGSGNPVRGVPLGRSLLNGSTVCADPMHWFLAGLAPNPSCFVLGRPHLGKSSLVRHMVTILHAWGIVPMVLSDTKPDYVDLIRELQGQVIPVGVGRGSINPLDQGPLVAELEKITDPARRRAALEEMRGRRRTTLQGLLDLVGGVRMEPYEQSIVAEALRVLDETHPDVPLVQDLSELVASRPDRLAAIALDRGDADYYHQRVERLLGALHALGPTGPFGDVLARPTSQHIRMGQPVVFDLSGIDDAEQQLLAAVQSVCWSYGSAMVSADKHLAESGLRPRRHYFLVMDELWRILRASEQMVYFLDALTRLNRQRAIGQAMITHTMDDLKLATPHLTNIARGFVERSGMVFLGGLAVREMGNLEEVFAMSGREKALIDDWSVDAGVNPETSQAAAPAGRGKFLLKVGKKAGVPFKLTLVTSELAVNDTNRAWSQARQRVIGQRAARPEETA